MSSVRRATARARGRADADADADAYAVRVVGGVGAVGAVLGHRAFATIPTASASAFAVSRSFLRVGRHKEQVKQRARGARELEEERTILGTMDGDDIGAEGPADGVGGREEAELGDH
ncbi:hypothetical protein THAOC_24504, partial [Thalassiosira oceanica]